MSAFCMIVMDNYKDGWMDGCTLLENCTSDSSFKSRWSKSK